jgi:putative ABC transport system ATP-binding protein
MDIFLKLNHEQKITTVMVTHDPVVGQQCRRTVRMIDGKLAEA